MPHHRHIHHRGATRRCCELHQVHRRSRQERPGVLAWLGASRIGQPPNREVRGREDAGRGRDRASGRDPDCWGRLQLALSRVIGGRG